MINPRIFIVILCIAALVCTVRASKAHDNPTDWIGKERRQNAKNEYCCGEGDCHPIPMREIIMTPGGYRLPSGDVIPFDKAAPSADEFFWTCEWGGERKCAFAPIGGT